jgi:hypothetical protein
MACLGDDDRVWDNQRASLPRQTAIDARLILAPQAIGEFSSVFRQTQVEQEGESEDMEIEQVGMRKREE